MKLKKCKNCNEIDWVVDKCGSYLKCQECGRGYPSPVAEALELLNKLIDFYSNLLLDEYDVLVNHFEVLRLKIVIADLKELKQILEKGE